MRAAMMRRKMTRKTKKNPSTVKYLPLQVEICPVRVQTIFSDSEGLNTSSAGAALAVVLEASNSSSSKISDSVTPNPSDIFLVIVLTVVVEASAAFCWFSMTCTSVLRTHLESDSAAPVLMQQSEKNLSALLEKSSSQSTLTSTGLWLWESTTRPAGSGSDPNP